MIVNLRSVAFPQVDNYWCSPPKKTVIVYFLTLYKFFCVNNDISLSDTRYLIQDVVSPQCSDKRKARSFMTTFSWHHNWNENKDISQNDCSMFIHSYICLFGKSRMYHEFTAIFTFQGLSEDLLRTNFTTKEIIPVSPLWTFHINVTFMLFGPIICLFVLISTLWCPLQFPHKNDVRFVFTSSCLQEGSCLIYVICVYLRIVVSDTSWIYQYHGNCLIGGMTCLLFTSSWIPVFSFLCCVLSFCLSSSCVMCAQCCQSLWNVHSWLALHKEYISLSWYDISGHVVPIMISLTAYCY
jgi:hypothetical protein